MTTKKPSRRVPGLALLLTALAASGCADSKECAPGTRLQDGACVAICEAGTEVDPGSGHCVPVCVPGTYRDGRTGACLPEGARCASGEVWVAAESRCLDVKEVCGADETWVASQRRCVPDLELREPDQFEGTGRNNADERTRACEPLTLPAMGESWSIGGRIEAPELRDGMMLPDDDCWAFEVSGPTLLRISAEGLGGASAAFVVNRIDDSKGSTKYGYGTTSNSVTRDLFLPYEGTWMIVASDTLNLIGRDGGLWRGGDKFGYLIDITQLPLPEPVPMSVAANGVASGSGAWPATTPAEGSTVAVYSMPVEADSLYEIEAITNGPVEMMVSLLAPDGSVCERGWRSWNAYAEGGEAVFVADYTVFFAGSEVGHLVRATPLPLNLIEWSLPETTLTQLAWAENPELRGPPKHYYAFHAEAGQVATVRFRSSTGFTAILVTDATATQLMGDAQTLQERIEPLFEGEILFRAPYTGLYLVQVSDWTDGLVIGTTLTAVPQHDYNVALELSRQTPRDLGSLPAPVAFDETVTVEEWQNYYVLDAAPGDVFRWRLSSSGGDFNPILAAYPPVKSYFAGLGWPIWYGWGSTFVWRADQAHERMLLGVFDPDGKPGSYHLEIEREVLAHAGTVSPSSPVDFALPMRAGQSTTYFSMTFDGPGDLVLELTPPEGVDIVSYNLTPELFLLTDVPFNSGGPGETDRIARPAGTQTLYMEVSTYGFEPLAEDINVFISATIQPLESETEPNNIRQDADPIEVGQRIAGGFPEPDGLDWYRLDLEAGATLDFTVGELGFNHLQGGAGAQLYVFDVDGRVVGRNDSDDKFAPILGLSLSRGTYYVRVGGNSSPGCGYVVEIAESL